MAPKTVRSLWLSRTFFGQMAIIYFIAVFFFGIMQQHKIPPLPIFFMQVMAVFLVVFFSYLYSKKSIAVTLTVVLIFQLICSIGLRMFFTDYFHNPLGYNPLDAGWYNDMATQFMNRPLREFTMFLDTVDILLDDRGFNYALLFIYKLAGTPERGQNLAMIFNVFAVTGSTYFLYKLALVYVEPKYANFTAFVWGTQLYSVYTGVAGLKENFMVFFVIVSLYYIATLWNEYTLEIMLKAIFFSLFALTFRTALFYILIASILVVTAIKFPFIRRYIIFFLVASLIFTFFYIRIASSEIAQVRGHAIDADKYEMLVAGKMDRSGAFASIVNYISAMIGPFPNIVAFGDKANYITLFSFSSFCKTFYAFFFLYAIYVTIRDKVVKTLPLITFWLLDILMLIITFYTLQDRYHWPHVSIVLLMSVWGGVKWIESPPRNARYIYYGYMAALFVILIMFNYR